MFVCVYRCKGKKSKRLWSNLKLSSHVQHITFTIRTFVKIVNVCVCMCVCKSYKERFLMDFQWLFSVIPLLQSLSFRYGLSSWPSRKYIHNQRNTDLLLQLQQLFCRRLTHSRGVERRKRRKKNWMKSLSRVSNK